MELLAFLGALGLGAAIVEGLWPRLQAWWFARFGERFDWPSERGL